MVYGLSCSKNDVYIGSHFHIITGHRINLAEDLIDRLHDLLIAGKVAIECKQVGPIIYIKDTTIQAFPSHTVQTLRGYTNVKFILLDDAAYFPVGQQNEVQAVIEGYRMKSDPDIVLVIGNMNENLLLILGNMVLCALIIFYLSVNQWIMEDPL